MRKSIVSVVSFAVSVLALLTLGCFSFETIREYTYVRSLSNPSGIDYFGLSWYPMLCCVTAFLGAAAAGVSAYVAKRGILKLLSCIFVIVFLVLCAVFGFITA